MIRALQYYGAYLKATMRDSGPIERLVERLERKPPAREESPKPKRKQA